MIVRLVRVAAVCSALVLVLALSLGGDLVASVFAAGQSQPSEADPGVRDTLQRYSAAFESLDPNAVKKVQPSVSSEALAKAFKEMRELKVVIDQVRVVSTDAASMRVSCRVTQTLTPKAGSRQTTAVTRVMRLRKTGDGWIIDGFER